MSNCIFCMNEKPNSENVCPHCGRNASSYQPAPHHLPPGTLIGGKYEIGVVLGEGGFGITYIGKDITLDLISAVKEYYPTGFVNRSSADSPEVKMPANKTSSKKRRDFFESGKQKFLNEARILARFSDDEGIVHVRDFFEENSTAYIVMEYLDGIDLKSYISDMGVLSPEDTIMLMYPVMKSLVKVHEQGLIHRDISPDNIRLSGLKIKLMDFGAARDITNDKSLSVMLKPGYAPYEQYSKSGKQGPWTDVYALCATMYKCMTGITPDVSVNRIVEDTVKKPSQLGVEISPEFENVLMQGLEVRADKRIQSVGEILEVIDSLDSDAGENAVSDKSSSDPDSFSHIINDPVTNSGITDPNANAYTHNRSMVYAPEYPGSGKKSKLKPAVITAVAGLCVAAGIGIYSKLSNSHEAKQTSEPKTLNIADNAAEMDIEVESYDKGSGEVRLKDKDITVEDITAECKASKIKSLVIEGGSFDASGLDSKFKNLTKIKISNCTVSGLESISELKDLEYLCITDAGLADISSFSELTALKYLDLSGNEISDLSPIAEFSELKALGLNRTSITSLESLSGLTALEGLYINNTNLTSLDGIDSLSELRYLSMDNCSANSIEPLKNLTKLEAFSAFNGGGDQSNISDISPLKSSSASMRYLVLDFNEINDMSIVSQMDSLELLSMRACGLCNYREDLPQEIAEQYNNVVAGNEDDYLDKGTRFIRGTWSALKYLDLSYNHISCIDLGTAQERSELGYLFADSNYCFKINGLEDYTHLKMLSANQNFLNYDFLLPSSEESIELLDLSQTFITKLSINGEPQSGISNIAIYNCQFLTEYDKRIWGYSSLWISGDSTLDMSELENSNFTDVYFIGGDSQAAELKNELTDSSKDMNFYMQDLNGTFEQLNALKNEKKLLYMSDMWNTAIADDTESEESDSDESEIENNIYFFDFEHNDLINYTSTEGALPELDSNPILPAEGHGKKESSLYDKYKQQDDRAFWVVSDGCFDIEPEYLGADINVIESQLEPLLDDNGDILTDKDGNILHSDFDTIQRVYNGNSYSMTEYYDGSLNHITMLYGDTNKLEMIWYEINCIEFRDDIYEILLGEYPESTVEETTYDNRRFVRIHTGENMDIDLYVVKNGDELLFRQVYTYREKE